MGPPYTLSKGCANLARLSLRCLWALRSFMTTCRLPEIHLQRTIVLVFAWYELRPWLSPGQSLPFGPRRVWGASHRRRPGVVYEIWLPNQGRCLEKVPRWPSVCSRWLSNWIRTEKDWPWCLHQRVTAVSTSTMEVLCCENWEYHWAITQQNWRTDWSGWAIITPPPRVNGIGIKTQSFRRIADPFIWNFILEKDMDEEDKASSSLLLSFSSVSSTSPSSSTTTTTTTSSSLSPPPVPATKKRKLNKGASNVDVSSNDDYPHLLRVLGKCMMVSTRRILQYKRSWGVYWQS